MKIIKIDQLDRQRINDFIVEQWYTMQMVVRGESIDLGAAEGFYACEAGEIVGLITYRVNDDELEILSLDSLREKHGIGTSLLEQVVSAAKNKGIRRINLITTNDNMNALRFYQKRGFQMVKIYRNAVDEARKIKPEIPLIGMNGIPLKDEIELEMIL